MSVIQVSLPDELQDLIGRQVAEGRAASEAEFLLEAARRYAEELDLEDEMVAEAEAGIADAGRYVTISTPEDAEAWHEQKMARLRDRLATDQV
jgi:Arc/MetJ-type ribon-helix-helix transcriptional regulator